MTELRALAHDRGLKYYLHLSKPELFSLLQRKEGGGGGSGDNANAIYKVSQSIEDAKLDVAQIIASAVATSTTRSSERLSSLKKKRSTDVEAEGAVQEKKVKTAAVVNTLDPIMLTELGPHTVEITRTNGSVVVYNVESLVQYILATGDFSEPETRVPFSDEDLRRIDVEASKAKIEERSVVAAKKHRHKFEEQKVKRDGVLGLERCASEYVNKMLEIVESDDPEEGEMLLIMSVFPSFSDTFDQIRKNDLEYAKHSMGHFIQYMKGPKNRPTVDRSGLLPVILGFFDEVDKGKQDASAFGF
uniref:Uncharacterized protein n=1 Tax=Hyaloperonospora arabidopsidis (strain Emoy2) TaxID=559515 RepID=M4C1R9_HYAAE